MPTLLLLSLALAQDAPAPSPTGAVVAVTVYPERATVTREVAADLVAGENAVVFRDLPPDLDPDTLQADGRGAASIRGLQVERRELAEDRRARVAALETSLLDLRDRHRAISDDKAAATAELSFVRSLSAAAAGQLSAELLFAADTAADADALAQLVRDRTAAALADARAADVSLRDVQAEIDAVERQLAMVRGAPQWARYDVTVLLDAAADGAATVSLSYGVPGASWQPVWDARATPGDEAVSLSLSAQVVQTTGEDWGGVRLTLSTARPAAGVDAPALDPFWLSPVYRVSTRSEHYRAIAEEEAMYDSFDGDEMMAGGVPISAEPEPMPAMVALSATVVERAVASTFEVPGASAVPGGGDRRKIPVADVSVPATWSHVVVPPLDERAWLVAEGTWGEAWPLLAGPVSVFVGDAYVGRMSLPTVGTSGTFELGFGPDDAVDVERVLVEDLRRGPNLWGRERVTRRWLTTVTNGRDAAVRVSVRDRLPVPAEAAWKVKPLEDVPDVLADEGLVRWERDLAAGAALPVRFGWQVKYPRKNPPGGL